MDFYRYEEYIPNEGWIDTPRKGDVLSCGDFKHVSTDSPDYDLSDPVNQKHLYIMPATLSGSDYSGTTYTMSNYRVFLKEHKKKVGVWDVEGAMGTYGIAIRYDRYLKNESIKSDIDGLEEYGVLCDEDHSEVEMEQADMCWKSGISWDVVRELQKSHPLLEDFEECETLRFHFEQSAAESGTCWEGETGGSMYIRVGDVTPNLRDRLLVMITPLEELPLLAGHTWESEDALEAFEKRLRGEELKNYWTLNEEEVV